MFETTSWKRVWSEDSLDLGSVAISHDGGKIACIRGPVVEVRPFGVAAPRQRE